MHHLGVHEASWVEWHAPDIEMEWHAPAIQTYTVSSLE